MESFCSHFEGVLGHLFLQIALSKVEGEDGQDLVSLFKVSIFKGSSMGFRKIFEKSLAASIHSLGIVPLVFLTEFFASNPHFLKKLEFLLPISILIALRVTLDARHCDFDPDVGANRC